MLSDHSRADKPASIWEMFARSCDGLGTQFDRLGWLLGKAGSKIRKARRIDSSGSASLAGSLVSRGPNRPVDLADQGGGCTNHGDALVELVLSVQGGHQNLSAGG